MLVHLEETEEMQIRLEVSVTVIEEESPPRAQMLSRVGPGKYERPGRSF